MNLQPKAAVRMLTAGLSSIVLGAFVASCGGGSDPSMTTPPPTMTSA